jgi:hypothetical protein
VRFNLVRATLLMAAGFLAIASGCVSAPPPPVATKLPVSETTVFAGNDLIASWFYDLHADCTPAALPTVKVTQTAIHGEVVIRSDGERYTEYPPTNDRHPCNKKKSPAVAVIYTADRTYIGTDSFSMKATFESGVVMEKQIVITIKPRPAPNP